MEVKDNSAEFLKKMEGRSKEESTPIKPVRRRLISSGLGRPRKFAGVVFGQDIHSPVSSGDFSGAIDMGQDLPSLAELAQREEVKEKQKKPLKTKNKIPLPPPKNRRDGRPKI